MLWEYDKNKYINTNPIQYIVKRLKYGWLTDEIIDLNLVKKYYKDVKKYLNKEEKWFLDFLLDKTNKNEI